MSSSVPMGDYLAATVSTPGHAVVWDLRSPSTPPVRVPTSTGSFGAGGYQGLALSPDGQTLYTAWPLTAYEVATGKRIWRREEVKSVWALDVNAEGTLLALGDSQTQQDAFLVDAASGDTVATLRGHRDVVTDIRFSPDGTLVGSGSNDGELIVWDTATGRPLERWDTFDPWGVGFSPDNDLVHGGGGDSMLRTWDLSREDTYLQQTTQVADSEVFAQADISPDGRRVAYRWLDNSGTGWVTFVDTVTGEATRASRLPVNEGPWQFGAWEPQGRAVRRMVRGLRGARHRQCRRLGHRHGPGEGRHRRRRKCHVIGVLRRRQSARGCRRRRSLRDLHRRRRDPAPPRRALRRHHELLRHPDWGREHRDGLRVHLRRHAVAGDRREDG